MTGVETTVPANPESSPRPLAALGLGLAAASAAAIFIRLGQENGLPALLIASGRLTLATLVLTPIVLSRYRHELAAMPRRDVLWALGAGIWLGLQFLLLNLSLEHTTVLVNQVLIGTAPLFVTLLEITFLKARFSRIVWAGLALAILGGVLIAASDSTGSIPVHPVPGHEPEPLLGALLALGAAVSAAVYLVIGRKVRSEVSFLPYVWLVFGGGAITVVLILILTGTPVTGYTPQAYFWLLMLTLFPQLIGHTMFNYVLGYLPATLVSISGQTVVVTSAILAFLIFGETPHPLQVLGSAVIIAGVVMAIRGQSKRKERPSD